VWFENGMSHRALTSPLGRRLYRALSPANAAYARLARRPNLESMLLARHRVIDHLLARAVDRGDVRQVIEIAAGFSPRGYRFAERYRTIGLRYVEGDLPAQSAEKRRLLDGAGLRGAGHEVIPLDALVDEGPASLPEVAASLSPSEGCAVITEGLLSYFDLPSVKALWRRIARLLGGLPGGVYLSDLHLSGEARGMRTAFAFRMALQVFARGRVYMHFEREADAVAALHEAGFSSVTLHKPADLAAEVDVPDGGRAHVVRIVEARVR
jgi:O-methyltransferase involved in polyketide biosynthesis